MGHECVAVYAVMSILDTERTFFDPFTIIIVAYFNILRYQFTASQFYSSLV